MLFTLPHDLTDFSWCTIDNLHAYRNRHITLIKPYVINTRINTALLLILPYLQPNNAAHFFKAQFEFKYTLTLNIIYYNILTALNYNKCTTLINIFTVRVLSISYLMINYFMQQVYKGNGSDSESLKKWKNSPIITTGRVRRESPGRTVSSIKGILLIFLPRLSPKYWTKEFKSCPSVSVPL